MNDRTFNEDKVVCMASIKFNDLLHNDYEAPFDMNNFYRYLRYEMSEENLDFYFTINKFHEAPDDQIDTQGREIFDKYVKNNDINVSSKQRKAVTEKVNKNEITRDLFNSMQTDILTLIENDTFPRFIDAMTLQENIATARSNAIWMFQKKWPTLKEFFSFPNPINDFESRLVNLMVLIYCLLAICFDLGLMYWVIFIGYLARTIAGPRLSVTSWFVLFVLRPCWIFVAEKIFCNCKMMKDNFVSGPPKRFAQFIGLVFSTLALILRFLALYDMVPLYVSQIILIILLPVLFLAWALNFCLGCVMFGLLMNLGIIPKEVCESCKRNFYTHKRKKDTKDTGEV